MRCRSAAGCTDHEATVGCDIVGRARSNAHRSNVQKQERLRRRMFKPTFLGKYTFAVAAVAVAFSGVGSAPSQQLAPSATATPSAAESSVEEGRTPIDQTFR